MNLIQPGAGRSIARRKLAYRGRRPDGSGKRSFHAESLSCPFVVIKIRVNPWLKPFSLCPFYVIYVSFVCRFYVVCRSFVVICQWQFHPKTLLLAQKRDFRPIPYLFVQSLPPQLGVYNRSFAYIKLVRGARSRTNLHIHYRLFLQLLQISASIKLVRGIPKTKIIYEKQLV